MPSILAESLIQTRPNRHMSFQLGLALELLLGADSG